MKHIFLTARQTKDIASVYGLWDFATVNLEENKIAFYIWENYFFDRN